MLNINKPAVHKKIPKNPSTQATDSGITNTPL